MLLPLLFLISASFLLPGYGEVLSSFNNCDDMFFKERFPSDALTPSNPAWICQKHQNQYVFATMYDRTRRIPIFSAYVYDPSPGQKPTDWKVEPQLANSRYDPNMEDEDKTNYPTRELKNSQAIHNDYAEAPPEVEMGHLNVEAHQPDEVRKNATFTLTNIVPSSKELIETLWKDYEIKIMARKKTQFGCKDTYVITGVVPGTEYIAGGRVNYPSHIWSAACCEIDDNRRESWGVLADNDWKIPPKRTEYTLPRLEQELTKLYNKKVDLFDRACY